MLLEACKPLFAFADLRSFPNVLKTNMQPVLAPLETTDYGLTDQSKWKTDPYRKSLSTASGSSSSRITSSSEEEFLTRRPFGGIVDLRCKPFFEDPWQGHEELIKEDWEAWLEDFRRRRRSGHAQSDIPLPVPERTRNFATSVLPSAAVDGNGRCLRLPSERRHQDSGVKPRLPTTCLIETPNAELTMARVRRAAAKAKVKTQPQPLESPDLPRFGAGEDVGVETKAVSPDVESDASMCQSQVS